MKATIVAVLFAAAVLIPAACGGGGGEPAEQASDDTTSTAPPAGPDSSALRVLAMADSAAEAVGSAAYDIRMEASGAAAAGLPSLSGRVALEGSGGEITALRASLSAETQQGVDSLEVAAGPDSVFLLDYASRTLNYGSVENGADQLLGALGPALLGELLYEDPFSDELASEAVRDMGTEQVGDVDCRKVEVAYSSGQRALWWFGSADYLPRRVDRVMSRGGQELTISTILSGLETGVEIPPEEMRLTAPEGWTVTEHMAFLPVGSEAPEWALPTPSGDTLSLAALEDTLVLMDFWATWCAPCLMVMPELQAIHEDYADRPVKVVGVNVWEQGDPEAMMADSGFTYSLALEGDSVAADYLVTGIPTLYLIDPEGRILYRARGAGGNSAEELRAAIDSVLED